MITRLSALNEIILDLDLCSFKIQKSKKELIQNLFLNLDLLFIFISEILKVSSKKIFLILNNEEPKFKKNLKKFLKKIRNLDPEKKRIYVSLNSFGLGKSRFYKKLIHLGTKVNFIWHSDGDLSLEEFLKKCKKIKLAYIIVPLNKLTFELDKKILEAFPTRSKVQLLDNFKYFENDFLDLNNIHRAQYLKQLSFLNLLSQKNIQVCKGSGKYLFISSDLKVFESSINLENPIWQIPNDKEKISAFVRKYFMNLQTSQICKNQICRILL